MQLALGKRGDLRLDAPPHDTMADLVEAATAGKDKLWEDMADSLAENGKKRKRNKYKNLAAATSPPKVQIKWNVNAISFKPTVANEASAAASATATTTTTHYPYSTTHTPPPTTTNDKVTAPPTFFQAGYKPKPKPTKKKKKKKPPPLRDKARQAAARLHWEIHHGRAIAAQTLFSDDSDSPHSPVPLSDTHLTLLLALETYNKIS